MKIEENLAGEENLATTTTIDRTSARLLDGLFPSLPPAFTKSNPEPAALAPAMPGCEQRHDLFKLSPADDASPRATAQPIGHPTPEELSRKAPIDCFPPALQKDQKIDNIKNKNGREVEENEEDSDEEIQSSGSANSASQRMERIVSPERSDALPKDDETGQLLEFTNVYAEVSADSPEGGAKPRIPEGAAERTPALVARSLDTIGRAVDFARGLMDANEHFNKAHGLADKVVTLKDGDRECQKAALDLLKLLNKPFRVPNADGSFSERDMPLETINSLLEIQGSRYRIAEDLLDRDRGGGRVLQVLVLKPNTNVSAEQIASSAEGELDRKLFVARASIKVTPNGVWLNPTRRGPGTRIN